MVVGFWWDGAIPLPFGSVPMPLSLGSGNLAGWQCKVLDTRDSGI